jgi:hypothetical protein
MRVFIEFVSKHGGIMASSKPYINGKIIHTPNPIITEFIKNLEDGDYEQVNFEYINKTYKLLYKE